MTAFGLLMFGLVDPLLACPNCKDSLSQNDPTAMGIVQGYFWSIILMLSLPFLVLGGLSTYFYLLVRRARRTASSAVVVTQQMGSGSETADPLETVLAQSRLPRWSPTLDS
jgi:heme/copper-type cytochrome/quinol oxidase subunit 2